MPFGFAPAQSIRICDAENSGLNTSTLIVIRFAPVNLDKLFNLSAGGFHAPAAFKISLPLRRQRERFRRVLIEGLSHQSNQVADYCRVLEQRFDDRMGQFELIEFFGWFRFRLLFTHTIR